MHPGIAPGAAKVTISKAFCDAKVLDRASHVSVMAAAAGVLAAAVDAVVGQDLSALSVEQLQTQYAAVPPQVQRLTEFAAAAMTELNARTGGALPTEQGNSRPLPGVGRRDLRRQRTRCWADVADRNRVAAELAPPGAGGAGRHGADVRAEVLTRLVGRIDPVALAEADPT